MPNGRIAVTVQKQRYQVDCCISVLCSVYMYIPRSNCRLRSRIRIYYARMHCTMLKLLSTIKLCICKLCYICKTTVA